MDTFWACAVAAATMARVARMPLSNFIVSSYGLSRILPYAQAAQGFGAALLRSILDPGIEAVAVAIHCNEQGAEAVDAELPQRLRIEVVEVDVLDRFDPRRLQRGRAADDREVGAAQLPEGLQRLLAQAALSDNEAHAVLAHERPGKALHAIACRSADADRGIAARMGVASLHLAHVGRGMDHRMAGKVEAGLASAIEHVDLRRVADAEQRTAQGHRVVDVQRPRGV